MDNKPVSRSPILVLTPARRRAIFVDVRDAVKTYGARPLLVKLYHPTCSAKWGKQYLDIRGMRYGVTSRIQGCRPEQEVGDAGTERGIRT